MSLFLSLKSLWIIAIIATMATAGGAGYYLANVMKPKESEVHTVVLEWPPRLIPNGTVVSGYVASWQPRTQIHVQAVQVWMGNPGGIVWEGDTYLTLNNQGIFNNSTDQVIVHYQFDKHAESTQPHQLWFPVGSGNDGFHLKPGQTVWVWFLFNNISDKPVMSGDGQVIIYYVIG